MKPEFPGFQQDPNPGEGEGEIPGIHPEFGNLGMELRRPPVGIGMPGNCGNEEFCWAKAECYPKICYPKIRYPKIPDSAIPSCDPALGFPHGNVPCGNSMGMVMSRFIPNSQSLSWQIQAVYPTIPGSSMEFIPQFLGFPGSLSHFSWDFYGIYPIFPGISMEFIPLILEVPGSLSRYSWWIQRVLSCYSWDFQAVYPVIPEISREFIPLFLVDPGSLSHNS